MLCLVCSRETANPRFCSRSCAARYNNRVVPKRTRTRSFCKHCRTEIYGRATVCDDCNPSRKDWSKITLAATQGIRRYQISSRIRDLARHAYRKSDLPKRCVVCGYANHYEVCHVKPIYAFGTDATVAEVNDLSNLIALCPNHHWELDRGLLDRATLLIGRWPGRDAR